MNTPRTAILLASARSAGHTHAAANYLGHLLPADLIELRDYRIAPFDYAHAQRHDDFLPLMRRLLADYDRLVLATPVYWYAMSAQLKIFLDRFTDLLTIEKPLGRQLRGKSLAVLACGNDATVDPAFWMPFVKTSAYLGMHYRGGCYVSMQSMDLDVVAADSIGHFARSDMALFSR